MGNIDFQLPSTESRGRAESIYNFYLVKLICYRTILKKKAQIERPSLILKISNT